jgi:hypothetical protein
MVRLILMSTVAVVVAGCASDPRRGYDRVQVGDSRAAVDRAMGKPEWTTWAYEWNDLSLVFTGGVATAVAMFTWDTTQRLPVASGMTPAQVEAIVGTPREVCNHYDYIRPKGSVVCFGKEGTVTSKGIFDPPEPPNIPIP